MDIQRVKEHTFSLKSYKCTELESTSSNIQQIIYLLEAAQRMTFPDQLRYWSLVKGPGDEKDYVVDHVAVGDVVHEHGQRPSGLVPHVLELRHQFLSQFVVNDGDLEREAEAGGF